MTHGLNSFAARHNPDPPARLGQRYSRTTFLPEPGNTVICALDQSQPTHAAVLAARQHIQDLPGAGDCLLFTPVNSLHMTVFEGTIDTRRSADAWPADLPRDVPISDTTAHIARNLAGFKAPSAFQIRIADIHPGGLILTGATEQDTASLHAWRAALTQPFGYRHTHHDAYRFHMTFAYPVDWLPDAALPEWETALGRILADLQKACPVLPLDPPAFCTFNDMTHFAPVVPLTDTHP